MIPKEIKAMLVQHPSDSANQYRPRSPRNHPFLDRIRLTFSGNPSVSSERPTIDWVTPPPVVPTNDGSLENRRLRNAYDATGQTLHSTASDYHVLRPTYTKPKADYPLPLITWYRKESNVKGVFITSYGLIDMPRTPQIVTRNTHKLKICPFGCRNLIQPDIECPVQSWMKDDDLRQLNRFGLFSEIGDHLNTSHNIIKKSSLMRFLTILANMYSEAFLHLWTSEQINSFAGTNERIRDCFTTLFAPEVISDRRTDNNDFSGVTWLDISGSAKKEDLEKSSAISVYTFGNETDQAHFKDHWNSSFSHKTFYDMLLNGNKGLVQIEDINSESFRFHFDLEKSSLSKFSMNLLLNGSNWSVCPMKHVLDYRNKADYIQKQMRRYFIQRCPEEYQRLKYDMNISSVPMVSIPEARVEVLSDSNELSCSKSIPSITKDGVESCLDESNIPSCSKDIQSNPEVNIEMCLEDAAEDDPIFTPFSAIADFSTQNSPEMDELETVPTNLAKPPRHNRNKGGLTKNRRNANVDLMCEDVGPPEEDKVPLNDGKMPSRSKAPLNEYGMPCNEDVVFDQNKAPEKEAATPNEDVEPFNRVVAPLKDMALSNNDPVPLEPLEAGAEPLDSDSAPLDSTEEPLNTGAAPPNKDAALIRVLMNGEPPIDKDITLLDQEVTTPEPALEVAGMVPFDVGAVQPEVSEVPHDRGVAPLDGVRVPLDKDKVPFDGTFNGGSALPDRGMVPLNGGAVQHDREAMLLDVGMAPINAGTIPPDASAPPLDRDATLLGRDTSLKAGLPDNGGTQPFKVVAIPLDGSKVPNNGGATLLNEKEALESQELFTSCSNAVGQMHVDDQQDDKHGTNPKVSFDFLLSQESVNNVNARVPLKRTIDRNQNGFGSPLNKKSKVDTDQTKLLDNPACKAKMPQVQAGPSRIQKLFDINESGEASVNEKKDKDESNREKPTELNGKVNRLKRFKRGDKGTPSDRYPPMVSNVVAMANNNQQVVVGKTKPVVCKDSPVISKALPVIDQKPLIAGKKLPVVDTDPPLVDLTIESQKNTKDSSKGNVPLTRSRVNKADLSNPTSTPIHIMSAQLNNEEDNDDDDFIPSSFPMRNKRKKKSRNGKRAE